MKRLLLILLISISLYGRGYSSFGTRKDVKFDRSLYLTYLKQLNNLTQDQKYWLAFVYQKCLKFNLGKTCVAIAWEESQFNVYAIVPETNDYGLMGINLYWYFVDNSLNYRDRYLRSKIATKLVRDNSYNVMYAIAKLEKLKNKYHNWIKVWAHYNGGSRPNWLYAKRILNKIIAFRHWLNQD